MNLGRQPAADAIDLRQLQPVIGEASRQIAQRNPLFLQRPQVARHDRQACKSGLLRWDQSVEQRNMGKGRGTQDQIIRTQHDHPSRKLSSSRTPLASVTNSWRRPIDGMSLTAVVSPAPSSRATMSL